MFGSRTHQRKRSTSYRHRRPGNRNRFFAGAMTVLVLIMVYYMFFSEPTTVHKNVDYMKVIEEARNNFLQSQQRFKDVEQGPNVIIEPYHARYSELNRNKDSEKKAEVTSERPASKTGQGNATINVTGDLRTGNQLNDLNSTHAIEILENKTKVDILKTLSNHSKNLLNATNVFLNGTKLKIAQLVNESKQRLANTTLPPMSKLGIPGTRGEFTNKSMQLVAKHWNNFTAQVDDLTVRVGNLTQKVLSQEIPTGNETREIMNAHVNRTREILGQMKKEVIRLKDDLATTHAGNITVAKVEAIKNLMQNVTTLEKDVNLALIKGKLNSFKTT